MKRVTASAISPLRGRTTTSAASATWTVSSAIEHAPIRFTSGRLRAFSGLIDSWSSKSSRSTLKAMTEPHPSGSVKAIGMASTSGERATPSTSSSKESGENAPVGEGAEARAPQARRRSSRSP